MFDEHEEGYSAGWFFIGLAAGLILWALIPVWKGFFR